MKNHIFEYFSDSKNLIHPEFPMRKKIVCQDGFTMSVQASRTHYSHPRADFTPHYSEYEVGYPSEAEELLLPYAEDPEKPTDTVYGYVPDDVINQVIDKHWGILAGVDLD